jgi:ABC-type glycerol-3-phosphate transport system substrate-binding protein
MREEEDLGGTASWLKNGFVERRTILKAGAALAIGGPLLAACTSSKTSSKPSTSSSGSASGSASGSPAADEKFPGITLNVACNPTDITPAQNAGKIWGAMTGATVNAVVVPYAERATDYATMIVDQNPHYDVLFGSVDFVSQFSNKLYVDLTSLLGDTSDFIPAALGQLSNGGKLYCAPLFADEELFWFNKTDWTAAGLDPTQIPTTWDEMYALAPKLNSGKREACVVPWNSIGVPFWLCYYNSTGGQLFNSDKSQLLFDNNNALSAWQAIGRGFDAKWYGPVGSNAASDQDTATLFNQNLGATQINIVEYYAQYGQKQYKSTITPAEVGVAVMPGITAGSSGSVIVSEGFGVNKFGKHQDAALSFVKYVTGTDFQKQVALGQAGDVLPPSRKSVNSDPSVQAGFPFGTVLNQQSGHPLAWPGDAPFDWNAPFVQALTNLSKGTWTPEQCHTNTVNAVHKLIVQNLGGS